MPQKVQNPETGRMITVGGPTYRRLYARATPAQKAKLKKSQQFVKSHPGSKQGAATRGWAIASPHRGPERHAMPPHCFLLPSEEKFPICAAGSGTIDCRALKAAQGRARQTGRNGLAARAAALYRQHGCRATSRTRRAPSKYAYIM